MGDSPCPDDVTEAELGVLQALWEQPGSTIRRLTNGLYPQGRTSQYATVQKLLERLEAKGFVARNRAADAHRFAAVVNRDELIGRRLHALAERLCEGSIAPLLSNLLSNRKLNRQERQALRAIVERLAPPLRQAR